MVDAGRRRVDAIYAGVRGDDAAAMARADEELATLARELRRDAARVLARHR